jgi:putative peptide zinc metalloprotease protein
MGMFVLAAAFHELGHAAGLRYGGGKVRAMGVGLYLVYPVFYTDITASYGLERPARLRADLGGFYFNALFQLALVGLYFVTGLEFLLLVVMLIDIEILYQLLPFVRMDGYWILADLTGIPDFFSRMGQTLRRLFPGAPQKKLPPLNHTARIVFALYMLIVLPILALLLFAAFRSFPSVTATAYASGSKLLGQAGDAQSHGDMLTAASDSVQVLLLGLQALGLALVIIQVLRRGLGALWGWAKPSAGRKGIASLATVATAALLVALWMPSVPATGNKPGPLYGAVVQATPIPPDVRGTIGEAVPFVPVLPEAPVAPTTAPQASASAAPTASSAPSATPTPTSAPSATPAPSSAP